jgi:abortive infection bacteriophage resistance protein
MLCLTDIRNICAHFDKLWGIKMVRYLSIKHPKLKRLHIEKNSLYSYVLIMYFLLKEIWIDTHFLDEIEKLFSDKDYINIDKEKMWFWKDWKTNIENILL